MEEIRRRRIVEGARGGSIDRVKRKSEPCVGLQPIARFFFFIIAQLVRKR
jgi:hypothetical protein